MFHALARGSISAPTYRGIVHPGRDGVTGTARLVNEHISWISNCVFQTPNGTKRQLTDGGDRCGIDKG
jgi:hypothetical protein